ncbi:MAG: pyruvate formate lyase family protein, partial [Clostridiales Family XIII bacterium]|nr:pyruvate formate lyase family protein [Clostridiales Family XIII bacterium]
MLDQLNIPASRSDMTRGQRIWDDLRPLRETASLSLVRAKLVTESYKETEGKPVYLRRAAAYENIISNLPIHIDKEQLLCGDFASEPMGFEWWPELYSRWVIEAIDNGWFTYKVNEEEYDTIKDICDYWKDRESKQMFLNYLEPEFKKKLDTMNEKGSLCFFAETEASLEKGWHVPNYEKVIQKGLTGILAEIDAELDGLKILDNDSYRKANLLRGLKQALTAAIRFAKRYAVLAADMAKNEQNPSRKAELEKMADVMGWIMENPARDFYDAVQTMFFTHICIFYDVRCSGMSFGRVDQYLYPYYEKDIESGKITRELARDLIECLRVKCSSMRQFDSKTTVLKHDDETRINDCRSGETQFHNCTIGGQLEMGVDATNDLSFLWLEAAMNVRTAHPTLTIRWHPALDRDFMMAAAKLNRLGLGFPAWYNDLTTIPYL